VAALESNQMTPMKEIAEINKDQELVSIIIAMYNAEAYIAETLQSVKNQTWKSIEIIVVNDGSTDGSAAVVESLYMPNLTFYDRKNMGQCAASNFGIEKAKGELIKFLDADDVLSQNCIENMVLKYRENPNRLVFGEWRYFTKSLENCKRSSNSEFRDYENSIDWYFDVLNTREAMLAGWMWLIPASVLEKAGGWDEHLHLMNDFEFSTRLILHSEGIGFAENAIHYYRKGLANSMTSKMNDKIALSIYTGVTEACNHVLSVENSGRVRKAFANQFQKWVYQFYPLQQSLIDKMETKIKTLGGSDLKPEGGSIFNLLNKYFSWKFVTNLQFVMHRTIWRPMLVWKNTQKLKRQFGN
jgi:glycosyltransferase involved in cell wall biosynthesis